MRYLVLCALVPSVAYVLASCGPTREPVAADTSATASTLAVPTTGAPQAAACALDTSGPPGRDITSALCLDNSQREGQAGPLAAPLKIGLVVMTTKRNGTAVADRARVDTDVAQVNQVFASGDVSFFVSSFAESDAIPPDVDNSVGSNVFFKVSDTDTTLKVLYVGSYSGGGGVAWNNGSGVVVDAVTGAHATLAHELAHAVGLMHTYAPDDFVSDTNFDPWTCELSSQCFSEKCAECRYTSCPAPYNEAKPDPQNVMAPAVHPTTRVSQRCNLKITPGQWQLIRCTLRTSQKRLMPPPPGCPSCPPGFKCEGAACVCHKTVCGGACISLGTKQNCMGCGDACAPDEKCMGQTKGCGVVGPCPGARDCGLDCNGNQVCVPHNKPGGCPHFVCTN